MRSGGGSEGLDGGGKYREEGVFQKKKKGSVQGSGGQGEPGL